MTIEDTLAERGNRYGSFQDHANIAQALQDVMRSEPGWERMAADQRQALTVIADKIARMLSGDPTYRDNWHDIVGYAKLVDDRMAAEEAQAPRPPANRLELLTRHLLIDSDGALVGKMYNDWHQMNEPLPPGTDIVKTWKAFADGTIAPPGDLCKGMGVPVYWALP